MKKRLPLIISLIAIAFIGLFIFNRYRVAPKMDFFSLNVYDTSNVKINFDRYKGKKIIITYYASWCGDCLREMKSLNEIREEKLKDIAVVAITDEPIEKLKSFQKKKKYPFDFYRLNQSFSDIGVYSIPVNYFVNSKGKTVWEKVESINWADNDYLQIINNLE
ncbi:MAG: TlpA family protein disulfide reductase [Bacteroidota bacterium]|jgi:thiol-disulfide isomerase/thioredoxin